MRDHLRLSWGRVGMALAALIASSSYAGATTGYYKFVSATSQATTSYHRQNLSSGWVGANYNTGVYTIATGPTTGSMTNVSAFCVDVFDSANYNPVKYTPSVVETSLGADPNNPPPAVLGVGAKQVGWLTSQWLSTGHGALSTYDEVDVGLAIWEIASDAELTSDASAYLGDRLTKGSAANADGLFAIDGSNGHLAATKAVLALAYQKYADPLVGYAAGSVIYTYVQSADWPGGVNGSPPQHFVYLAKDGFVPEPAFYQLAGLIGMGTVGVLRRKRRRA